MAPLLEESSLSLSPLAPDPSFLPQYPRRDNPGESRRLTRGRQATESSGSGGEIGETQDRR